MQIGFNIKRLALIVSAVLSLLFVSCGKMAEPLADEVVSAAMQSQISIGEFIEADEKAAGIIFDIDYSLCEEYSVYYSDEAGSADIIAVFKTKDDEVKNNIVSALEKFLEIRLEDFKGYAPLEVQKIEKTKILSYGDYEILMILPDFEAAENALNTLFYGKEK